MRAERKVYITLTGKRLRETDKAVLFLIRAISGTPIEKPKSEWFPFSQISKEMTRFSETEDDEILVSEWILDQKGLNDE